MRWTLIQVFYISSLLFLESSLGTPVEVLHTNSTREPKSSESYGCLDADADIMCAQCEYFERDCRTPEGAWDPETCEPESAQRACDYCDELCRTAQGTFRKLDTRRRRRQVPAGGSCGQIKAACGGAVPCCATLTCQSTSAGRGNRRKTCRFV